MTKTVCYFDLETDHRHLPQKTPKDCAQMARALLMYILGAYLFANSGQTLSLRWLPLFCDFREAREANWGQAYLTYLYSSLDTLSQGTLRQLVGSWNLLEVNSFFLFLYPPTNMYFMPLQTMFIHMPSRFTNCSSCSCKLCLCLYLAKWSMRWA